VRNELSYLNNKKGEKSGRKPKNVSP
jgi:hypothetical protein